MLYYLIIAFLCLFTNFIYGQVIYYEDFETVTDSWCAATTEKNEECDNGWKIINGQLFQLQTHQGQKQPLETYFFRREILNLEKFSLPIILSLDMMPIDYFGEGEVWFGPCLFFDPVHVKKKHIKIVLRKYLKNGKEGLHVSRGRNNWIFERSNIQLPLMNWCRLEVKIQYSDGKDSVYPFSLKANIWDLSEKEPNGWQLNIAIDKINLDSTTIALGAGCERGRGRNPRVAFDNLVVYSGDANPSVSWLVNKSREDHVALLKPFTKSTVYEFESLVRGLGETSSLYSGVDESLFYEMLVLRRRKLYPGARKRAALIMNLFTYSPLCEHFGGITKTEDQAAEDFAQAMSLYHKHKFEEARTSYQKFIQDFPHNWRRDKCLYYDVHSLYLLSKNKEKEKERTFLSYSDHILNKFDVQSPWFENILFLQATTHVRLGEGEEARIVLEELIRDFPDSRYLEEFKHVYVESFLYKTVIDKINQADIKHVEALLKDEFYNDNISEKDFKEIIVYTKRLCKKSKNFKFANSIFEEAIKENEDKMKLFIINEYFDLLLEEGKKEKAEDIAIEILKETKNMTSQQLYRRELVKKLGKYYKKNNEKEKMKNLLKMIKRR